MHGKRRKRSPLHQSETTAHVTDPTVKKKSNKLEVKSSDHPRVKGGSIAVGLPGAASKIYKGIKSIFGK